MKNPDTSMNTTGYKYETTIVCECMCFCIKYFFYLSEWVISTDGQ